MDSLTIPEYELLMEAAELKQVDKDYRNHLQAFLNFVVKAEKRVGKNKSRPRFCRFDQFYNYERAVEKITDRGRKKTSRFAGIGKYLTKGG